MKIYADTSFIVRLVTTEPGSEEAMAEFRRLGFPRLLFSPLHFLEVTNAIYQRAFHLRHNARSRQKPAITRERDASLARIERWLGRGWFVEVTGDFEKTLLHARTLSTRHTERLGCRGFDILHVALALEIGCDTFLTEDRIQRDLARAEGLETKFNPA